MARSSSTLSEVWEPLIGTKLWLEYADQNIYLEQIFESQFVTILRQFDGGEDRDDWYLVRLDRPFEYEGRSYDHLVISSRWAGEPVGDEQPTSIFMVLAPEPENLKEPFEIDRKLYIAWGMAGKNKEAIDRLFKREE